MDGKFFCLEVLKSFNNNKLLVYRTTENKEKVYLYNQVVSQSQKLLQCFRNSGIYNVRISLQCPHSPDLCIIILSILNCKSSFCGISPNANASEVCEANKQYRAKFFVSNVFWGQIDSMKFLKELKVLEKTIYIFEVLYSTYCILPEKVSDECYCIKTSGSTGIPKVIRVPMQSIVPNIKSLSTLLKLTPDDLILLSSPITFDPFVVEYFLALLNGSALLIIESGTHLTSYPHAGVLQCGTKNGPTIAQMTPSLFRMFGLDSIRQTLLDVSTSLRILLLGGERFPSLHEISAWTRNNNWKTRIFNIYGITEVSCWSTIYEIKRGSVESCTPIGSPLDTDTEIRVVNDLNDPIIKGRGYIEIGSATRKCIVGDECQKVIFSPGTLFRSTNDICSIADGNIFYEGRKDDFVKRYGNRVNLSHITTIISAIHGVVDVCCGFDNKNMQLICFIIKNKLNSKREIKSEIFKNLENVEKPDDVKFVDYFPLTSHGKVSREELLKSIENSTEKPVKRFERFIRNVLGINTWCYGSLEETEKRRKTNSLNLSFLDAGGTSFQALTLATQLELLLKRPEPSFLKMLLDGATSLITLLDVLSRFPYDSTANLPPMCILSSNNNEILKIIWKYDTGKCVDSTPTCYDNAVSVGSHSRLLITLDSVTGHNISSCILPDRIECQVCFIDHHLLIVGCYDGKMYVVNYVQGEIMWLFDCEGMIKSRPLRKNNLVVIGSYSRNENLVCLDMKEKTVQWKRKIGSKGVFSSPVEVNTDSFLICSLSGEVACIRFDNGNIVWDAKFQSPIFSTPTRFSDDAIIIAEVSGVVHCLQATTGVEIWEFKSDGSIFSGIVAHKETDRGHKIFFGCHDNRTYCLQSATENQCVSLVWRKQLDSAIYSTPAVVHLCSDKPAVLSCSTKGNIYILDYVFGFIIFTLSLNGEIFSSPFVSEKRIYVGCRDNNLVCLKIVNQ